MSFQDMFSIFKKRELSFIESRQETEDVYSFLFERERFNLEGRAIWFVQHYS